MAVSVNAQSQRYLQIEPRQGVYIRPARQPTHCSQHQVSTSGAPPRGGGRGGGGGEWCGELSVRPAPLKWRPLQFRSPSETYKYRARVEPPQPHSQYGRGVQALSDSIIKRQVSCPKPGRASPLSPRSSSYTSLPQTPTRCPATADTAARSRQLSEVLHKGPAFTITAQAVVMQPRPPQRSSPSRSRSSVAEQLYSYPDPNAIRGNAGFDIRLTELARLQSDTVRYEESKRRIFGSYKGNQRAPQAGGRPSSAKGPQRPASKIVPQAFHRQSLPGLSERGSRVSPAPGLLSPRYSHPFTSGASSRATRPLSAESWCSSDSENPVSPPDNLCASSLRRRKTSASRSPKVADGNNLTAISEMGSSQGRAMESNQSQELTLAVTICAGSGSSRDCKEEARQEDAAPNITLSDPGSFEDSKVSEGSKADSGGHKPLLGGHKPLLEGECNQNDSLLEVDLHTTTIEVTSEPLPLGTQGVRCSRGVKELKIAKTGNKKTKAKRKSSPGQKGHCTLRVDRVSSTTSLSSSSSQRSTKSSQSSRSSSRKSNSKGRKAEPRTSSKL